VIVNPTHVAVALRWDESQMDAPTVTASGREQMAHRIIAEARKAGVPVVHDPGLARTLADLRTGEMIPEDLYEAVAAVIGVIGAEETGSQIGEVSHGRGTLHDRAQRR
jgi:flagellar biosynthesis protein FlhB